MHVLDTVNTAAVNTGLGLISSMPDSVPLGVHPVVRSLDHIILFLVVLNYFEITPDCCYLIQRQPHKHVHLSASPDMPVSVNDCLSPSFFCVLCYSETVCSITRPIAVLEGEEGSKARPQRACSLNLRKAAIIVFPHNVDQRLTPFPPIPFPQQRPGPAEDPSTLRVSRHSPKPQVGRVQISGS